MAIYLPIKTQKAILHLAAVIRGRKGGLTKSRNRAAASKRNGTLGGRPRKAA